MHQEKETVSNAEQKLEALTAQIAAEREAREFNVMQAIQDLDHGDSIFNMRRLFFDMSLQYASDPKNAVDDSDRLDMLQMFEVLNVM